MPRIRLISADAVVPTHSGIVLHSDVATLGLEGDRARRFVEGVLPLLDGSRDRDELAVAVERNLRPHLSTLLGILTRLGLLETMADEPDEGWISPPPPGQRFFESWADHPDDAIRRLSEADILIVGPAPWGAVAAAQLAAAGARPPSHLDGWAGPRDLDAVLAERRWDLVIGALAAAQLARQLELAQAAHRAGLPSLFAALCGMEAVLGPVVIPGQTACWNCCRLRRLANAAQPWAQHAVQVALLAGHPAARPEITLTPMVSLLGHLLALEAVKLVSGYTRSNLLGQLLVQNMATLETTLHAVVPMPWCEVCGGASAMGWEAQQSDPPMPAGTPEELRRSLPGWVDPSTGVICRVALGPPDGREATLPFRASAFLSSYTDGCHQPTILDGSGGKGLTPAEALAGAVGEAIERYSAARFRVENLRHCPPAALDGHFLDPRSLGLYEDWQYDRLGFPFVRFDPDRDHYWVQGQWLDNGEPAWVPALATYLPRPHALGDPFHQVTTNGLAAGPDMERASLHALFELVERDAIMLTWLSRQPGRQLVVDDALEPGVHELLRQLRTDGANVELYLLDAGLPIPTVICLGLGDGQTWPGMTVSSAAHLSPRIAARQAILEQGFSGRFLQRALIRGEHRIPERPDEVWTVLDHGLFYLPAARASACDFLRAGDRPAMPLAALPEPAEISLAACTRRLAGTAVRVVIVDVTSPDVAQGPFRVARALGTGLQQPHFGFGLERLGNPRLRMLLAGNDPNPNPHPLC